MKILPYAVRCGVFHTVAYVLPALLFVYGFVKIMTNVG